MSPLLAIINNTAMNIVYRFLYGTMISSYTHTHTHLGVELLSHIVTLFNLLRNYQTVFPKAQVRKFYHISGTAFGFPKIIPSIIPLSDSFP